MTTGKTVGMKPGRSSHMGRIRVIKIAREEKKGTP